MARKRKYDVDVFEVALKAGVRPNSIYAALSGEGPLSFVKAVAVEEASGGRFRVEDLVSDETRKALEKYLSWRCPRSP